MGCIKYNLTCNKLLQCKVQSKTINIVIQNSIKTIQSEIQFNPIKFDCIVTSSNGMIVNTLNLPKLDVSISIDVTDIYTDIYQDCNVQSTHEDFIVDGMVFKFIDDKIFKVLKQ